MPFRPPVSTTLRAFTATPFDIHIGPAGVRPDDAERPRRRRLGPGVQRRLPAVRDGGRQGPRRASRGPTGISLDDPDRDGYCEEITEGDLDVAEWYLLNHPAPARGEITAEVRPARSCSSRSAAPPATSPTGTCPPPTRPPRTTRSSYDGDRRFFELQVGLQRQDRAAGGQAGHTWPTRRATRWLPRRQAYTVRGIYSDFKYHDVGEAFYQMQFDGSVIKKWRTAAAVGRRHARRRTATTAPASTSTTSSAGTAARRWSRARRTPP